ncbi:MAG: hypothetical protein K2Y14_01010 [Burkholderiales bacterium]|nr:hypothetical protein [Burkholderiales bacterium]
MPNYPKVFQAKDHNNDLLGYWFINTNKTWEDVIADMYENYGDEFCEEESSYIEVENS